MVPPSIPVPTGENKFLIAPVPGGHFTYANAAYKSIFGEVKSGWKRDVDKTVYSITIPANCSAKVVLGNENFSLTAGDFNFEI